MDNQPAESGFGDSFTDFPVDALLDDVNSDSLTVGLTGGISAGGQPDNTVYSNDSGTVQDVLDPTHILDLIPGASAITSLLKAVSGLVPDIQQDIKKAEKVDVFGFISTLLGYSGKALRMLEFSIDDAWKVMSDIALGPVFTGMLELGLDVHLSEFSQEELAAVQTVDTMLGFAMAMPLICAGIDSAGKALLANRWPEAVHETLAKLPEEMGLSWALGTVIDESFSVAQGEVLAEAIRKQKRPTRIEWPQLRTMLKQGVIEPDVYLDLLRKAGFPDEQIDYLDKLRDIPIPVGDIQQLWYRGSINDDTAKQLFADLGFDAQQVEWLYDLYIAKADTAVTTSLRNLARQMFADHLIEEGQFRTILLNSNYPKKLIDADVAEVKLEQSVGTVLHSVAVTKNRYQHGEINPDQARQELATLHYSAEYITELIQSWDNPPNRAKHGLSSSKILAYMVAGIIQPEDAKTQLMASGLTSDAADFLVAHPSASPGIRLHARSPGLVLQAYVDGAVQPSDLESAFSSAGVKPEDMSYYVSIAHYRLAHRKGGGTGQIEASASDWKAAFKKGLIDYQQLVAALKQLNYSDGAAMLIAEIENGGPYQPSGPPIFNSLEGAISYVEEHGFNVIPPPDRKLIAAEAILAQNGYSWIPNTAGLPGGTTVISGGPPPPNIPGHP